MQALGSWIENEWMPIDLEIKSLILQWLERREHSIKDQEIYNMYLFCCSQPLYTLKKCVYNGIQVFRLSLDEFNRKINEIYSTSPMCTTYMEKE